jgi:Uma2 family endonuclease
MRAIDLRCPVQIFAGMHDAENRKREALRLGAKAYCVLFEVLSDSTEDYDRDTKFKNYRSLPSLRDYVLVSQGEVLVEHFVRQPDGSWLLREHRAGARIELSSAGCGVDVDELYLKVFGEGLT